MRFDTIGKNIKKFRLEKKLRQEDLAEKTELSSNYIGMVERGEKIPSLETFVKILNALEISADMVLNDVVDTAYIVKHSLIDDKLSNLSSEDKDRIYDVIDALIKHSKHK